MKSKYIFILLLLLLSFLGLHVYAEKPINKDNVLIYQNPNGISRGYDLMWKAEGITGTYAQESPIIRKDDVVYVTSINRDGMPGNDDLFALDAYTGEEIARYHIGPTFGDALIDGDTLFIGIGDETWRPDSSWNGDYGLYSFDISDIRNSGFVLNWFHQLDHKTTPSYLVDENNIYLQEFEGNQFKAIDKNTGNEIWSFTKGNYGAAYNLLHGDYIYLANSYQGGNILYKINKTDGTEVWHKTISGKLWDNSITYSKDDDALFMGQYYNYNNPKKYAISYDMEGNERWSYPLHKTTVSYTSYHNGSVFFADLKGWIYSFKSSDGTLEWETQIGKPGAQIVDIATPIIANGKIFVGTKGPGYEEGDGNGGKRDSRGRGAFYILDEETGNILWRYEEDDLGDVMSLATVTDGIFYNATNAWDVYAFDVGDGTTHNHLMSTYDQDNTFSTETGLTQDRYVQLQCSTNGNDSLCDAHNLYAGRAVNVRVNTANNAIESVTLSNGEKHIYVEGSNVFLPEIPAQGNIQQFHIISGAGLVYDTTLPQLTHVNPGKTYILKASYNPTDEKVFLKIGNTDQFTADVEHFSRPFYRVTSIIDNGIVHLSGQGLSGEQEITSVDMELSTNTSTVETNISSWDSRYMEWTEKGGGANTTTSHTIGNLIPNAIYRLSIDGQESSVTSDQNGVIQFDFAIGDTLHNFLLKKYELHHHSEAIHYVCKDPHALNYSRFGRHKQSLCKYETEQNTEETTTNETQNNNTVTESNPLGGKLCSQDLLIHNFMKQGDKDGTYSSYNKGIVTEVKRLQSHINRILKNDYTGKPAGPVDGIFGKLTKRGVERLQTKLNQLLQGIIEKPLIIDGIVGPKTQEAINHSC